jgi:hypothetical protein
MDTTNHNEMKDPAAVQSRAAVRDMNKTKADEFNHNNAKTLRANQLKVDAAKAEDFLHPDAAATRERQRTTGLHTADHALMGARATTDRIHHALSALDDAAAKERMSASDYARRYMQASGAHTLEHMQDAILDPEKAPEQAALEAARHAILYRVGNP